MSGMENSGNPANSGNILRDYFDSLLVETRYVGSYPAGTEFELFGRTFQTPVMTAALSHLDERVYPGARMDLARAAKANGAVFWMGVSSDDEVEEAVEAGCDVIEIIKPYADRDKFFRKLEHAKRCGVMAAGVDIDLVYKRDFTSTVDGEPLKEISGEELIDFVLEAGKLPFIVKGILSVRDAEFARQARSAGMVISHHGGVVDYAVPPLRIMEQLRQLTRQPMFLDCGIRDGLDVYKSMALGATAVSVGTTLIRALKEGKEAGAAKQIELMTKQLQRMMTVTGVKDVKNFDATVIHRRDW